MFEILDRRTSLTGNQIKILAAAIIGDALEFFDYFLIGFVLAFLIGPWKLTFGKSAIVLLSSGVGAIIGAYVWGWLADRIGADDGADTRTQQHDSRLAEGEL